MPYPNKNHGNRRYKKIRSRLKIISWNKAILSPVEVRHMDRNRLKSAAKGGGDGMDTSLKM